MKTKNKRMSVFGGMAILVSALVVMPLQAIEHPEQGDVVSNDNRLGKAIPASENGELTVVSFNVRNMGSRSRSIKDYTAIADLVDEADVVFLQEVGLGLLRSDTLTPEQDRTLRSIKALLEIQLGSEWQVAIADTGSGSGAGRETSLVAYRKNAAGYSIDVAWQGFEELGTSRDMATWALKLTNGTDSETLQVGSVHLTPNDPDRGSEMIKMTDWLLAHKNELALVLGDMNYGYNKKSGVENYLGENYIAQQDQDGNLYQLFRNFSYLGAGKSDQLRTNMGYRKSRFFYDQFLLSPPLAEKMAHGATFLKDCGMIAFGVHNKYMKSTIDKLGKNRSYGLTKYANLADVDENSEPYIKTGNSITSRSEDDATWAISDHRPIWVQLKIW